MDGVSCVRCSVGPVALVHSRSGPAMAPVVGVGRGKVLGLGLGREDLKILAAPRPGQSHPRLNHDLPLALVPISGVVAGADLAKQGAAGDGRYAAEDGLAHLPPDRPVEVPAMIGRRGHRSAPWWLGVRGLPWPDASQRTRSYPPAARNSRNFRH
jgi:hypothetical protein